MTNNEDNPATDPAAARRKGVIYGVGAYLIWGFFPVYFKAVKLLPPLEMVSQRVIWSLAFLLVLITWKGAWRTMLGLITQPKSLAALAASTLMIGTNWLVFIYAVSVGEVLQSSLGYFINPLVSVLLGFVFLGERLQRVQWISLFLAVAGVGYLAVQHGSLPWISLVLGITFGFYGLIRKSLPVEPLLGLTVETLLLAPFALLYVAWLQQRGASVFLTHSGSLDLLVAMSGFITAIPLLMFAACAKRLRLATVGFLQYLTPTIHFLLAVGVYGETFTTTHLISFLLIWSGLVLYSLYSYRAIRASVG
jgi:chloramphenicol-sensitive protein RarD